MTSKTGGVVAYPDLTFHAYNDHGWVSGAGDSGKTFLVQYYLIPLLKHGGALLAIYDYNHNYDYNSKGEMVTGLTVTHDYRQLARNLIARKSTIFQAPHNQAQAPFFEAFCKVCIQFKGIVLVMEEIQEFVHKHTMPDYVSAIIHTGRNAHRSYVVVTQRPQEVPTVMLSNAKHRFYFKQDMDSETERRWMRGAIGQELTDRLHSAPDFHYVYKLRNANAVLCKPLPKKT